MKTQAIQMPTTESETQPALPAGLQRIVLTGFMGAGKSTIGRQLAGRLDWTFLDLDTELEARAGLTIPQIFTQHGEAHFRHLESTTLAHALGQHHTVLALGGGAIESLTNRLLLEQTPHTLVLFLDAPFPVLYDRCMLQALNPVNPIRPVLADPAAAELRFNTRHPLYSRLARITLDTTALAPEDAVDALLSLLSRQKLSS